MHAHYISKRTRIEGILMASTYMYVYASGLFLCSSMCSVVIQQLNASEIDVDRE